jgi:hypothetical protein
MSTTEPKDFAIDDFAFFEGSLLISGWIKDPRGVAFVSFDYPSSVEQKKSLAATILNLGRPAPSGIPISLDHGDGTAKFRQVVTVPPGANYMGGQLVIGFDDGSSGTIGHLGFPRGQRAHVLHNIFWEGLPASGTMLEIGARARSGVSRRQNLPKGWDYVGLDILDGENVDVVGDAHELSTVFPDRKFDAFQTFSTFEHLLMPWKAAIELNRVLNVGATGFIQTHQTWPLHETPWDFYRFSDQAWAGLFNRKTGFEIVETQMGEPSYLVARRVHAVTAFGTGQGGYLASSVIVRKVGETDLRWDVGVDDAITTSYPPGVENTLGRTS